MEYQRSGEQGSGNRGKGNQRDPPVAQKQQEHGGHHRRGHQQLALQIADRAFNKTGLAKRGAWRFKAGRQGTFEISQRRFNLACQLHGIGTGLLLHAENHGRLAVEAGIATLDGRCERDVGDLSEQDWLRHRFAFVRRNRNGSKIVERSRARECADQILAAIHLQKSAAGIVGEIAQGVFYLLQRNAQFCHACGVRLHLKLAHRAANRNHLRHTGQVEQPRSQHPICIFTHSHRYRATGIACRVARIGQCDQHDLAHDRRDRPHCGGDALWQLLAHQVQAFRHQLARTKNIGGPAESHVDEAQSGAGGRAHAHHAGHAAHRRFEGNRDQLFDFLWRHAAGLRHEGNGRAIEVRKHVNGCAHQRQRTIAHQHGGGSQYQQAVSQARIKQGGKHG